MLNARPSGQYYDRECLVKIYLFFQKVQVYSKPFLFNFYLVNNIETLIRIVLKGSGSYYKD